MNHDESLELQILATIDKWVNKSCGLLPKNMIRPMSIPVT